MKSTVSASTGHAGRNDMYIYMWLQYLGYSVKGAQFTPSGKQKSVSAFNVFSSSSFWNRTIPSFCTQ